jgi:hypothetical protein
MEDSFVNVSMRFQQDEMILEAPTSGKYPIAAESDGV